MNRNFIKIKNYKEIKAFIQNEYIRIADIRKKMGFIEVG